MSIRSDRGKLIATIASAKVRIIETELEIIQIDRDVASEVAKELREVDAKIGEFVERKVAAEDQLKRIHIRARQAGIVHQSAAHIVDGVINPGEAIMLMRWLIEAGLGFEAGNKLVIGNLDDMMLMMAACQGGSRGIGLSDACKALLGVDTPEIP